MSTTKENEEISQVPEVGDTGKITYERKYFGLIKETSKVDINIYQLPHSDGEVFIMFWITRNKVFRIVEYSLKPSISSILNLMEIALSLYPNTVYSAGDTVILVIPQYSSSVHESFDHHCTIK
ncbi:3231_t:CDS:2 [Diversispora eburnea]|uniref:3231_t:CDS:1 n=1 Tax=Diversispora eburnea TaxID=1213867 RepID=A0A9N8ZXW5_9GLOM|nr:3231_t:CDS:2 [Diversispora eburnea]